MNDEIKIIAANYEGLFLFAMGWISANDQQDEFNEAAKLAGLQVGPLYLVPAGSKISKEDFK